MHDGFNHNRVWMCLFPILSILFIQPSEAGSGFHEQDISENIRIVKNIQESIQRRIPCNIDINSSNVRMTCYAGNWWMRPGWDNQGRLPKLSVSGHDYIKIDELAQNRKINWSVVAREFALPYVNQFEIEDAMDNYEDLLNVGLAQISENIAETVSSSVDNSAGEWFRNASSIITGKKVLYGNLRINPIIGLWDTGLRCSCKISTATLYTSWDIRQSRLRLKLRIPLYERFNYLRKSKICSMEQ